MAHELQSSDSMMSVRQMPWHGLGTVLADYPQSIDEALEKSGLGWTVRQGSVVVSDGDGDPLAALRVADELAAIYADGGTAMGAKFEEYLALRRSTPTLTPAAGWRANRREDDGTVLGIVSDDYKVVQNIDAFRFLDALISSDLYFETAGSLNSGKRVWVLVRLPEFIEVAGDDHAMFVYCCNSHDGSMAVTAAPTPVRIVCGNTWSAAIRRSESERYVDRVFKFRHTGDLQLKYDEARKVMGLTVDYAAQFKAVGDRLAQRKVAVDEAAKLADALFPVDPTNVGKVALRNRGERVMKVVDIFAGGTGTEGNAPGTAWTYANAVAEFSDWERRVTVRTDQIQRSFEDSGLKSRGLAQALALV